MPWSTPDFQQTHTLRQNIVNNSYASGIKQIILIWFKCKMFLFTMNFLLLLIYSECIFFHIISSKSNKKQFSLKIYLIKNFLHQFHVVYILMKSEFLIFLFSLFTIAIWSFQIENWIFFWFCIVLDYHCQDWTWMKMNGNDWLQTIYSLMNWILMFFFYFRWKWIRLICGLLHRYDFIISLLYAYADDNNYFLLESQQINRLNSIDWSLFNLSLKYNDNWISNKWMNERANVWCKLDDFFPMFSRFFHFFKRSISTSPSSCCWSTHLTIFKANPSKISFYIDGQCFFHSFFVYVSNIFDYCIMFFFWYSLW